MKALLKLTILVFLVAPSLKAQSDKRTIAIREYGQIINSMAEAADNLNTALLKAKTASSAARAIDGFSNRMAAFQNRLLELDRQNPELEGVEPPAELLGHISRLESSMTTLAQTLAAAGEKYGDDEQFQASAARLAQTLGAEEEVEEENAD